MEQVLIRKDFLRAIQIELEKGHTAIMQQRENEEMCGASPAIPDDYIYKNINLVIAILLTEEGI